MYLISCAKCDQQYVGETKQKVSARLSGHRSSIKKHANTFIARHFNLPGHTMDDIRVQPIEHITRNPGETEKDITIRRLDRERFWMLELGTMYPYGLNDRLQHVGNVSHSSVRSRHNVFNLFHRQQRRNRSHGHRSNSSRTSGPRKSHWTYFAICTTVVKVMVTSIVFSLLFIAPGYQIYINYLLNVNNS